MYQCEERKAGKVECWDCQRFMPDSDECLEDSVITPVYRMLHPESKPVHFVKQNPPRQLVLYAVEIKPQSNSKIKMQADSNSQPHRVAGSPEEATSESERIGSRQTASQCVDCSSQKEASK